jgi:hypothetical protein
MGDCVMGCFSFLCKECDKPVNSDSHSGQNVNMYLLKDGKVLEEMSGQYNSYGNVFTARRESVAWESMPWDKVCDLIFSANKNEGLAVVHTKCFKKKTLVPTTKSKDDPNQGWGRYTRGSDWEHTHIIYEDGKAIDISEKD